MLCGRGITGVSEDIGQFERDCAMRRVVRSSAVVFFEQDGAPAYRAGLTLASLFQAVNVVAGWPPNRWDLDPIEMAWRVK